MSAGKRFEAQLVEMFKREYPQAWVARFTDSMTGKGMASVKSPPDMIAVGVDGMSLLVEAKATKGTSIAFDRLADHQLDHLERFTEADDAAFGMVALLQYNGLLGKQRLYRGWLLPIGKWTECRDTLGRKSLPFSHPDLDRWEMTWVPGTGWTQLYASEASGRVQ